LRCDKSDPATKVPHDRVAEVATVWEQLRATDADEKEPVSESGSNLRLGQFHPQFVGGDVSNDRDMRTVDDRRPSPRADG
jgi:hypothetical protein